MTTNVVPISAFRLSLAQNQLWAQYVALLMQTDADQIEPNDCLYSEIFVELYERAVEKLMKKQTPPLLRSFYSASYFDEQTGLSWNASTTEDVIQIEITRSARDYNFVDGQIILARAKLKTDILGLIEEVEYLAASNYSQRDVERFTFLLMHLGDWKNKSSVINSQLAKYIDAINANTDQTNWNGSVTCKPFELQFPKWRQNDKQHAGS